MIERKVLKDAVPHGYGRKIAAKAKVSRVSVSKFLNGKTNSPRIQRAVLEVLVEESKHDKELLKKIK